jgi:uncharacterized NAD(P)/FAD-binding protein YdhS
MIDEEVSQRINSLKQQFGGENNFEKWLENAGEEKFKEIVSSIETAANESLSKFFIFRKILEKLEINDVDWELKMDAEKKLYGKLMELGKVS